jgi:hypothetical protein
VSPIAQQTIVRFDDEDLAPPRASLARDAALLDDLVPARRAERTRELLEAVRVLVMNFQSSTSPGRAPRLEHLLHDSFEQRHVAVDAHLQEEVCELRAAAEQVERVLRVLEARSPASGSGLMWTILQPRASPRCSA